MVKEKNISANDMFNKVPAEDPDILEIDDDVKMRPAPGLLYGVSDIPPLTVSIAFALQICIDAVSYAITFSILIAKAICAPDLVAAKIMNTSIFLGGFTTLLQTTIGIRLPVFQGATILYVMPIIARAALPDWKCLDSVNGNGTDSGNTTDVLSDGQEYISWEYRLAEISGSLMAVSLIHTVLGYSGAVGYLIRFVGPLTITPALVMLGLNIIVVLTEFAETSWTVSSVTFLVVIICSCYLAQTLVPMPSWSRRRGLHTSRTHVFRPFGIVFAMIIGWVLSYIFTETGVFSDDPSDLEYKARTDNKDDVIEMASWVYVPYPGQFGPPKFNVGIFFGLIIAMITSVIDSVADYILTSNVCRIGKPPPHAVNRGLFVEGMCSIIAGAFGAGNTTTTYSTIIGNLSLTGIASRRAFQFVGIILMIIGIFGKLAAFLVTMPKPVVGGFSTVGAACMIGMALSSLEEVDLSLPRNVVSLGLPLVMGTMIPSWVKANPGKMNTGVKEVNQLMNALLSNSMFVGGVVGCFLDNTLPGKAKKKESDNLEDATGVTGQSDLSSYELPYVAGYLRSKKWTRFIPILPQDSKKTMDTATRDHP